MSRRMLILLVAGSFVIGLTIDIISQSLFPFLELGITGGIVSIQLHFFLLAKAHVRTLEEIFPDDINASICISEENIIINEFSLRESSKDFYLIIKATHDYIKNNTGAVDFNIIKEITERQNNTIDKAISSTLSVPLYVGLLGTMFGIVYGLFGISYPLTDMSLSILLDGVKIAMIGSFFGLGLTILNAALFYKSAKLKNDKTKNDYYTFIQTKILGTNTSSLTGSLNGLNQRLKMFGKSFDESISCLDHSINLIENVSHSQLASLQQQKALIDEIKEIGLAQITSSSLKIFEQLKNSMVVFEKMNDHLSPVLNLVEQNNENLKKIDQVYSRLAGFNGNLEKAFENIYDATIGNRELGEFLKKHYSGITSLSEGTQELVKEQKKVLAGENETFKMFLDEKQQRYTKVLDNHLNDFSVQMKMMGDKMLETIAEQEKGICHLTGTFDKMLQKNKQVLTDKVLEMHAEWEKSLKEVFSETKINKLEINIEHLKNEFNVQNDTLTKIVNVVQESSNPMDDEMKTAFKVMGDYYRQKMEKKDLGFWKRIKKFKKLNYRTIWGIKK